VHDGILAHATSGLGQNPRLPHRNIGIRFTPVSRHYASEALQPFVAPSMSSLDSDFVLRAIQVFGSTIAKAWRCRAFNSFSASTPHIGGVRPSLP
jgi:hypothetical protein